MQPIKFSNLLKLRYGVDVIEIYLQEAFFTKISKEIKNFHTLHNYMSFPLPALLWMINDQSYLLEFI